MRLLAMLVVLACAGCASKAPATRSAAAAGPACTVDPHVRMHWPQGVTKPPLVVAFHPAGTTAAEAERYYGFDALADRDGVAVAYPSSTASNRFWQLRAAQTQDVANTRAMLDALAPCVDVTRVYGFGVSNGGGFTARVGCELADRFAAVAPVAGGYKAIPRCRSGRAVGLLEIHGLADTVVPYRGSGPRHAGAVKPFVERWAARDGCARSTTTHPRRGVTKRTFAGCAKPVTAYALAGTTHGLPGARGFPMRDPTGLKGRTVAWDFFGLG